MNVKAHFWLKNTKVISQVLHQLLETEQLIVEKLVLFIYHFYKKEEQTDRELSQFSILKNFTNLKTFEIY